MCTGGFLLKHGTWGSFSIRTWWGNHILTSKNESNAEVMWYVPFWEVDYSHPNHLSRLIHQAIVNKPLRHFSFLDMIFRGTDFSFSPESLYFQQKKHVFSLAYSLGLYGVMVLLFILKINQLTHFIISRWSSWAYSVYFTPWRKSWLK